MSEKPKCFSYVNSNNDYLMKLSITRVKPCKECELLEACVAAYNERVYDEWLDDHLDDDGSWDFLDDQQRHEDDILYGEMMDREEQRELENPDTSMLDDYEGVQ